ncbi:MAG: hypothetical protein ACLRR3_04725 [Eubacterium sp.]
MVNTGLVAVVASEFGRNGRVAGGIKIGDQAGMKTAFAVMGRVAAADFS